MALRAMTNIIGCVRITGKDVLREPSLLDAQILNHLKAENTYQSALMADTKDLQKTLFAEMKGRIKEDDSSIPVKDGAYAYGISYVTGGQHPQYFRTPRDGGDKTILIDGDKEAASLAYFSLGGLDYSPNHTACLVTCRYQRLRNSMTLKSVT